MSIVCPSLAVKRRTGRCSAAISRRRIRERRDRARSTTRRHRRTHAARRAVEHSRLICRSLLVSPPANLPLPLQLRPVATRRRTSPFLRGEGIRAGGRASYGDEPRSAGSSPAALEAARSAGSCRQARAEHRSAPSTRAPFAHSCGEARSDPTYAASPLGLPATPCCS